MNSASELYSAPRNMVRVQDFLALFLLTVIIIIRIVFHMFHTVVKYGAGTK